MRLNTRISNETKCLILKMQKDLVNEKGGCFVTQGYAIYEALKRYYELKETNTR